MARVALESSGLDPARVIGTGTMLETARLRAAISRDLSLDPDEAEGFEVSVEVLRAAYDSLPHA